MDTCPYKCVQVHRRSNTGVKSNGSCGTLGNNMSPQFITCSKCVALVGVWRWGGEPLPVCGGAGAFVNSVPYPLCYQQKMSLFENSRELQSRSSKLWQKPQASPTNKGRSIILRRRRKLGGAVLNKSPLERSKSLGE